MAQVSLKVRLFSWVTVIALGLLGGWLGTQAADREMPVVVYTAEATNPVVAAGSELRIEYTLERRRSCDVVADRFIFDKFKTRFELPDLNLKAGLPVGRDHYVVPVRVPEEAAPGPAVYRTMTIYLCNPLQRLWPISAGVRDIPFLIK